MNILDRLASVFGRRPHNGDAERAIDKLDQESKMALAKERRALRAAALIHDARRMDDRLSGRDR